LTGSRRKSLVCPVDFAGARQLSRQCVTAPARAGHGRDQKPTLEAATNRLYRFFLAHTWSTSTTLLPDGRYRLEVEASDLYGNKASLQASFTLANDL
jgi:hypothetical protein